MKLWTANLETLKGFYASDAYVVAMTKEEALVGVMNGLRAYVEQEVNSYGYIPYTESYHGDPEWEPQLAAFYAEVQKEADEKLREVPTGVIINIMF